MRFFFACIMALSLATPLTGQTVDLRAVGGRLAVPEGALQNRIFSLKGVWGFYPNQILSAGSSCPAGAVDLDVMAYWNAEQLEQHPDWNGTSSFCLEIDNKSGQALSMWWPERIVTDVYGNGALLFGHGLLKDGKGLGSIRRQTGLIHLPHEEKITVMIHANNEFMRWRKVREDVFFGETALVSRFHEFKLVFDIFVFSALLVTGFYQFALYLIHRDRRETLFLGLFCCALAVRYSSIGHSNLLSIVAPALAGEKSFSLGYLGYFMAAACFYHFLSLSYPDLILRRLKQLLWIVSIVFSLICLIFGSELYGFTLLAYHAVAGTAMLSSVYAVTRALLQKKKGSLLLAVGTFFLTLTAWADMIRSQGMGLDFDIFPLGQLVFVMSASLLVSIRFSHAFEILSHLSLELSKIVPLHVIPLLRSGTKLENCMPIGEQEAVVLVFDVVGSSKVVHPGFRKALDLCMARFYEAINQGYHAQRLEATGYRVKEMGDGMICTVGFPFKVPAGKNPDSVALHLAEQMCSIFHQEMARLNLDKPIYCGIGLARGLVEGFFPRAGQKQYDLRGHPLTLATRYESMRNPVYRRHGQQGSVIFIHDAVYQRLSLDERQNFLHWETTHPGQQIRDDGEARQAWFKFVTLLPSAQSVDPQPAIQEQSDGINRAS